MIFPFIFQSILLSLGVATDAFVVATANGINHTKLNKSKILVISILFGLFQGLMPLIGYFVGNIIFSKISYLIPSVSLCILSYLGIKMILSSKESFNENIEDNSLKIKEIFFQAIATSIDALAVGLTLVNNTLPQTLLCVLIISLITFTLSYLGVILGRKIGNKITKFANLVAGIILIYIGIQIFISSLI